MKKLLPLGFALSSASVLAQSHLQACYALDGNALDASKQQLHGTVHGATLTKGRTGILNTAYRFNGVDDYIDISHPDFFNSTTWTYSCWIQLENLPASGESTIIMSMGGYGGDQVIAVSNNYFGHTGFHTWSYGNPGTITSISTSQAPQLNEWHFVLAVRSENTLKLYVNGVLVSEGNTPDSSIGYGKDPHAMIGQRSHGVSVNSRFKGSIDEVRVHDYALCESEIEKLFQTNGCESCVSNLSVSPEACYSFEENTFDGSGNGLDGKISNSEFQAGFIGELYSFHFSGEGIDISHPELHDNHEWTYATWVKLEKLPETGFSNILISIGGLGSDQTIAVSNNYFGHTGFHAWSYENTNTVHSLHAEVLPLKNTWYHVAASRSSTNFSLYINGELVDSKTLNNAPVNYSKTPHAFLGTRSHSVSINNHLKGNLDEVKLFNKALPAEEISSLYQQSCPCKEYVPIVLHQEENEKNTPNAFPVPIDRTFSIKNNSPETIDKILIEDLSGNDLLELCIHLKSGEIYPEISAPNCQGVYLLSYFNSSDIRISTQKIVVH
jgi:hypothetical protein